MRVLTDEEVGEVSGGVVNLVTGGIGAAVGGAFGGLGYAANELSNGRDVTLGGFLWAAGVGATSGFLIGTGTGLVYAAATGAAPGAAVLGVTMIGTGGAVKVAGSVSENKDGGS